MSIEVNNETTAQIDAREFVDLARYVFDAMFLHPATELSITFVDEKAMSELHEEWMDLEGPTDVMSFPMDELREGREGELAPEGLLGDIVICPTVAAQQARIAGHSSEEEMLLLLTHGILHLLGYDHVEPEEERVMFTLQRKLLLTFLAGRGSRVGICDTGGPDA
ncbi:MULTISPECIES: rRNA maturation RNase YbeY [Dermabacter]|mgnify:CR=1 FL=1|uniref:rRNA maturation RNase YbeY n=1 Tax=Dermabacter TaxID=36739 RepID=UPI000C78D8B2|nr:MULTISPECIES: rRNA maturation RNase YbeY [Dermabacter]MCG7442543.1 rRNA maturation RNase YbeY [Dermabacter vaginalis]MCT1716653.1 rRNA maturation RNase YbeY [Dermabacter hominis]MCT1806843.1 rRNA maturation RNase YbeY [Dermabacter hominis]MCT1954655.1 rRNA maturation RNase YbeY [Dermabacter hominis]MCT2025633.1 rRNA maturation RNase YbeY [Dermabacter hominis]